MTTPEADASVCQTVVEAVAEATGREVTDPPPLFHSIDPEALENLFEPRPGADGGPMGMTFEYGGCHVTVERDDGEIQVGVRPDPP